MRSILLFLVVSVAVALASEDVESLFVNFKAKFNKQYPTPDHEAYRFAIFKKNVALAKALDEVEPHATFGVTKFSDLSPEEFRSMYLTKTPTKPEDMNGAPVVTITPAHIEAPPATFSWTSKPGVLTPVKNQEQCGSCWAFSTVETVESQNALAGKGLFTLAPQQIVDCDKGDDGCNGGDTITAYKYVQQAGGLEQESDYPYVGKDTKCSFDKSKVAASISGFKYVTQSQNETAMQLSLPIDGPPSICVDASSWQTYTGGVITKKCGTQLDHCVQLTGFDTSSANVDYWEIRNSWGEDWGEKGFVWVERGKNLCGVAVEVTLAVV